uniref:Uncharacterized protein n=1 Tax=Trieres chinensis TaxID=1514140 RepID=A0A7S2EJH0_TRICV|mmetsp:Transcript_25522/g.52210  ORF Transcript_25522/g.52210 Transcript_25522/m.52210 type:complete len:576 (+) Transcript_25522:167-1894(+)
MDAEDYIPAQYELVPSASAMSQIPRFGRTSQFSKIFSFSNEEQTDYTMGLIFITAFLLTFFTLWTVAIFVFICMGPKEAGFLSGHPFAEPEPSVVGDVPEKPYRRPRRIRWTFLVCNILVIMFSVLFVTHGMEEIRETAVTFGDSNQQLKGLIEGGRGISSDLVNVTRSARPVRDTLVIWLDNFCPNIEDLTAETGIDLEEIAQDVLGKLEQLEDFVEEQVTEFEDLLVDVEDASESVDSATQSVNASDWKVILFVLPLIILSGLLLIALLMAWFEVSFRPFEFAIDYIILPLFGICVTLSWFLCSFSGMIAAANGDFCSGGASDGNIKDSPEGTFLDILDEQQFNRGSIIYNVLKYYITDCDSDLYPLQFLEEHEIEVNNALNSTTDFSTALNNTDSEQLQNICGSDFMKEKVLLGEIKGLLQTLAKDVVKALDLMSCKSINSLYANTFHEGTCTHSVKAFTWIFSSLLVISLCGMLMLTFRASLYEVEWYEGGGIPSSVKVDSDEMNEEPVDETNNEQKIEYQDYEHQDNEEPDSTKENIDPEIVVDNSREIEATLPASPLATSYITDKPEQY